MDSPDVGPVLLAVARSAIAERFGSARREAGRHPALSHPAATFVTLRRNGDLRGCIGSLEPVRSLAADVRENAVAAAFQDPRFPPLEAYELEALSIEVSLLALPEPIAVKDEAEVIARLEPGVDGVILRYGDRRATFLPQVWESFADPREFLAALKHKAGLAADFWSREVDIHRYRVTKWAEAEYQ